MGAQDRPSNGSKKREDGMKGDERKRRLSPAMVIALIALVITLTGTAYAALNKNSVGPH